MGKLLSTSGSDEKSKFRQLGLALSILSAFTLGIAVSYLVVDNPTADCPIFKKNDASPNNFYYWAVRAAAVPLPIFVGLIT